MRGTSKPVFGLAKKMAAAWEYEYFNALIYDIVLIFSLFYCPNLS